MARDIPQSASRNPSITLGLSIGHIQMAHDGKKICQTEGTSHLKTEVRIKLKGITLQKNLGPHC